MQQRQRAIQQPTRAIWTFALLIVFLSITARAAVATPIILTLDSSTSTLGTVFISGTVAGDFDSAAESFKFTSGGDILATNLTGSATIPLSTVVNNSPIVTATTSGSFNFTVPTVHLDLTDGTVVDGSNPAIPTWNGSGLGTLSGSLVVNYTVLGVSGQTTVTFTADISPLSSFKTTVSGLGSVALSDTSEISLTLPFDVPFQITNTNISGGGLLVDAVANAVADQITGIQVLPLPGVIVAHGSIEPIAVPEPSSILLVVAGFLSLPIVQRKFRR